VTARATSNILVMTAICSLLGMATVWVLLEPGPWMNRALFFGLLAAFLTGALGLFLFSMEPPPPPSRRKTRPPRGLNRAVIRALLWALILTFVLVIYSEHVLAFWNILALVLAIVCGEILLRTTSKAR
jgi:hypothetical protein